MIILTGNDLTLEQVARVSENREKVSISKGAKEKVLIARRAVENALISNEPTYGVNTGFGDLINKSIKVDQARDLQKNLIRSHSSGYGNPLDQRTVRAMILVRANALAKGYSGVRVEVIQSLLDLINNGIYPLIPEKGSVGSSGDLSPLAHLASVLMGEGKVLLDGRAVDSGSIIKEHNLEPIKLEPKEGISLINGTSYMLSGLLLAYRDAENLLKHAIISSALTMHALSATRSALNCGLFEARPHIEHGVVAKALAALLEGSENIDNGTNSKVQDAYSLRCIPTVLGSVLQTMNFVKGIIQTELNSATDNPLVLEKIISGCNFHGEPLALSADYLSIALTEIGNISERRIFRMLDKSLSGLSPFLAENPGVESGLMVPQYVAAALCNENKVLCYPSSADNIPTSANQEDHNSMGATSVRKLGEIVKNVRGIIAIEMMVSYRAMEMYGVSGKYLEEAFSIMKHSIGSLKGDVETTTTIDKIGKLIDDRSMLEKIPVSI